MLKHDWQERLEAYIEKQKEKGYALGKSDCFQFVSKCIEMQTGKRVLNIKYRTLPEASDALKARGGAKAAISSVLGHSIPIGYAKYGDVVLVERKPLRGLNLIGETVDLKKNFGSIRTIGIVARDCKFALVKVEGVGLVKVHIDDCQCAWSVEGIV